MQSKDLIRETGPWDAALAQIRGLGSRVGGRLREDDHQSVELGCFALQDSRDDQPRDKCGLHQSQS